LGDADAADRFTWAHPEGSEVEVHYNPQDPNLCATQYDGVSAYDLFRTFILVFIGLLFIAGGVILGTPP
jgi:hypothetical protein